ncbi:MAG: PEP/pyruvate-binding domain-containing protein, partial [Longimicrobiales bacterium]|nr:PEP/pyruvate-binding domain-containing protein [Longimicrobiales bacterium]
VGDALQEQASSLAALGTTTAAEYKASLAYLARSLDWARGTVRGTFAPVVDRYVLVEPAALAFYDATLRGSVMLPLAGVMDDLQRDADRVLGATHSLFGVTEASGLRGLNPGVAVGPLDVLEPEHHEDVRLGTIYLLPQTPPELKPVAGVLTMDEGNLLSHVQLLARNLGIPNAAISPRHEARLRAARGQELFYAVTPLGRVVVKSPDELDDAERALLADDGEGPVERHRLDTSRLRLDVRSPIPLDRLRSTDSGVLVGPKAANLGQLAADFPGRVSPAVALPFGMFVEHADRPYGGSQRTVLEELKAAYGRAAAMQLQGHSAEEIDAFMLERLAWVRLAIERLAWLPEQREAVVQSVTRMLDGDIQRGVFVRSDTNVEDLPQFSGAGLNLTVPHQTSMDRILESIKRVWTSPFSERAYLWRRQILEEQGEVYPSVLLQQTVPSAKSGVLITAGLEVGDGDDVTVVAAEGVGGAVEGEDAETILLRPSGDVLLLSQTKAPRRREIVAGGTRWVAASRPDTLLTPGEIAQLREVVRAWEARKAGTPEASTVWDMEFGFLDGRLWLFQVRPFIRFRNSEVYMALEALDAEALGNADRPVSLAGPLEGS